MNKDTTNLEKRKIIQICVINDDNDVNSGGMQYIQLVALASDGSIWHSRDIESIYEESAWKSIQLPPL